jgi:hypothetical protein
MISEKDSAKTPREHFTRDAEDEPVKLQRKERTLQGAAFGQQHRSTGPIVSELRTHLLSPEEIWRNQ